MDSFYLMRPKALRRSLWRELEREFLYGFRRNCSNLIIKELKEMIENGKSAGKPRP
ncbi:hypothetical protein J6TS7_34630 [Paenibacillus dendritiformis]|nr:hypothetical protein J6TS7_34630 [Paenibacillus dendritiformis]